jgi:hypothetical protein
MSVISSFLNLDFNASGSFKVHVSAEGDRTPDLMTAAAVYIQATRPEKKRRLDELVELTHYTRRLASRLMGQHGKKLWLNQKTKVVGDLKLRPRRERARGYDESVKVELVKRWKMMDYICGKRLQPALAELVEVLERHNELSCDAWYQAMSLVYIKPFNISIASWQRRAYFVRPPELETDFRDGPVFNFGERFVASATRTLYLDRGRGTCLASLAGPRTVHGTGLPGNPVAG